MAWLLPSIWRFGRLFGRPLIKQTFGNYQLRVQHLNKLNCTPSTKQCQSTKHCLSQLLPTSFLCKVPTLEEPESMQKQSENTKPKHRRLLSSWCPVMRDTGKKTKIDVLKITIAQGITEKDHRNKALWHCLTICDESCHPPISLAIRIPLSHL